MPSVFTRPLATTMIVVAAGGGAVARAPQASWVEVVRHLHDPDVNTRLRAVEALSLGRDAAAADAVTPLIADPDLRVRFAAIDAEVTFFLAEPIAIDGPPDAQSASSQSRAQQAFDAGPLARSAAVAPPGLIDALVQATRDGNARIRFDALHALGFINEGPLTASAVQDVAGGLDASDPVFRTATARVLGRLRAQAAGDKLIAALNDRDPIEQRYVTEALGLVRETRAVTSLLDRLDFFKRGDLAATTLLALGRIGHPSAHDAFVAHLGDDDPAMRWAAVEGLGRLGNHDAEPAIEAREKDESPSVRLAAAFALTRLGTPEYPAIVAGFASHDTFAQALDYLLELGPAAVPAVEDALQASRDVRVRGDLIHLLGFIGDHAAIEHIEPFLKDHNDRVARAAIDAVARLSR